ncbi:unnamed protein product [Phytophthora fragariaefolia]|uniref:Unnamed protein product n=1 Tax=Phytophthora fragariaefolia TaxID=1490495 RepID=A0A9W6YBN2_9STRA|nr:unnamed protein product [Phytophthora fragariaefolia]
MVCVGAIALHSLISSHAVANQAHEPAISEAPEAYSRPKGANMQDGWCGVYKFDCSIGMDDEGIRSAQTTSSINALQDNEEGYIYKTVGSTPVSFLAPLKQ